MLLTLTGGWEQLRVKRGTEGENIAKNKISLLNGGAKIIWVTSRRTVSLRIGYRWVGCNRTHKSL